MTTIVGVEDMSGSVIVADSATTSDNRPYQSFRMPKIVQREQTVISCRRQRTRMRPRSVLVAASVLGWRHRHPIVHSLDDRSEPEAVPVER